MLRQTQKTASASYSIYFLKKYILLIKKNNKIKNNKIKIFLKKNIFFLHLFLKNKLQYI